MGHGEEKSARGWHPWQKPQTRDRRHLYLRGYFRCPGLPEVIKSYAGVCKNKQMFEMNKMNDISITVTGRNNHHVLWENALVGCRDLSLVLV